MFKSLKRMAAIVVMPFLFAGAVSASTIAIDGGITRVVVTADLAGLGLSAEPTGSATAASLNGRPVLRFPITGGQVTPTGAIIEHDGSGVRLFTADAEATVGNFVIDTENAAIFGNVGAGTDFVPLFDLGFNGNGSVRLNFTAALAGALTSVFGAPDLTGAQFGRAITRPELAPVPLPAPALMLIAGVGVFAGLRRRQKAKAA